MIPPNSRQRNDAQAILQQALAAVDPASALRSRLSVTGGRIRAGEFSWQRPAAGQVVLLAAGKAAGPMACLAEELLVDYQFTGLAVTKYAHAVALRKLELIEAGHPLPDANGLRASLRCLQLARRAGPEDLVLCLLSGGGSALLPAPVAGVTLADKLRTTDLLLRAGADIHELNTLRKHLSRIKGGGLARAAHPATLLTLAISDVIGDPPEIIASGPTVPDPSSFAEALAIVKRYQLVEILPESVMHHLRRGLADPSLETWKPEQPPDPAGYQVIAGIEQAARAAQTAADRLGYRSELLTTGLTGEARLVGAALAAGARDRQQQLAPGAQPVCLIAGGETTVKVAGKGLGGRNQELALAAGIVLDQTKGISLLAAGTDGSDGPTDAAGAIVDGTTLARSRALDLNAEAELADNNSYGFFTRTGELLITGPTRTNVMDLVLILIDPPASVRG